MRLVQRYAEALAAVFTRPIPRHDRKAGADWIDKPNPADRVDSTMSVRFIAGDGAPAFRMVTCMEAAEVCAAVRDTELDEARRERDALAVHLARAEAALDRVRDVHHVHRCAVDGHIHTRTPTPCVNDGFCECGRRAPCPTVAALDSPEGTP